MAKTKPNLFASAQKIEPKASKAKAKKAEVRIDGLAELASIAAVVESLSSLKETFEAQVKSRMTEYFVEVGTATGERPDNFYGFDDAATASCELRRRSSASGLTDAEVDLLVRVGIPTEQIEDRPDTFIINPVYKEDAALMDRVGKVLGGIKDIPEDFIQHQVSRKKTIVNDQSLSALFKLDANQIRELISVVGTLAVKPKIDEELSITLNRVRAILGV